MFCLYMHPLFIAPTYMFIHISDINECTGEYYNGGCDHTCTNSEGSYGCVCNAGYELAQNLMGCLGESINIVEHHTSIMFLRMPGFNAHIFIYR